MQWIKQYQLFLFDFDGLLVNTETLHFEAYKKMCLDRGFSLSWNETIYQSIAMQSATGIKERLLKDFPDLASISWELLYQEKKRAYLELLKGEIHLMEGAFELLSALKEAQIKSCLVTNSPKEQVEMIKRKNPILNTITHFITREEYSQPKPHPECYQKAIELYAKPSDKIIGFEDSPRGFQALSETRADKVFVSSIFQRSDVEKLTKKPFYFTSSLSNLQDIL